MPIKQGEDEYGKYYKYGEQGKKYYYSNEKSRIAAKEKAYKQGIAIQYSKSFS
ncbi:MAG TPA: hypothetical protein PKI46_09560 [Bacteroidales bacterium]|nr:hypothetical protein [Bacteroidales bacterium]